MSEGLQSHYHQYNIYDIRRYYDKEKGCMVKNATYRCIICGKTYHERYEYKPPPPKEKDKDKVLQRNKRRYSKYKLFILCL